MNIKLVLGITIGLYLAYLILRSFMQKSAMNSEYRRMMHDLLKNEKYQVKGKFE